MAKKKNSLTLEERLENALVPDWEQPYKVPSNWVWTRLDFIGKFGMGQTILSKDLAESGIPVYSATEEDKIFGYIPEEENRINLESHDLVIPARGNSIGYVKYISEQSASCTQTTMYFKPYNKKVSSFLYYYMKYNKEDLFQYSGNAIPQVTISNIKLKSVPLPPLAEQQRIVELIESLFSKLDEANEKVQITLDSFDNRKTAILHKAFTGELTKKWREENGEVENDYLENIQEYLDKLDKKDRIKMQEQIDKIEPCEIAGWLKCSVGAIGVVTNGSTPSRKINEYWNGKINWLSSGEVKNNIIRSTRETITQVGYDNSSVKLLPKDTVLIAMIGEGKTRGQSAILEMEATINQNIAAVVVNKSFVSPKFLWYCFQMNYTANREKGSGSGPQALNCQRVRELDFILPTLAEQIEIVRILDNIFEKEQKAKELVSIIEKIDLMKKAILARAFRGELDTNNPKDDSALELLKEILSDN